MADFFHQRRVLPVFAVRRIENNQFFAVGQNLRTSAARPSVFPGKQQCALILRTKTARFARTKRREVWHNAPVQTDRAARHRVSNRRNREDSSLLSRNFCPFCSAANQKFPQSLIIQHFYSDKISQNFLAVFLGAFSPKPFIFIKSSGVSILSAAAICISESF
jgi:hypothetical protein